MVCLLLHYQSCQRRLAGAQLECIQLHAWPAGHGRLANNLLAFDPDHFASSDLSKQHGIVQLVQRPTVVLVSSATVLPAGARHLLGLGSALNHCRPKLHPSLQVSHTPCSHRLQISVPAVPAMHCAVIPFYASGCLSGCLIDRQ